MTPYTIFAALLAFAPPLFRKHEFLLFDDLENLGARNVPELYGGLSWAGLLWCWRDARLLGVSEPVATTAKLLLHTAAQAGRIPPAAAYHAFSTVVHCCNTALLSVLAGRHSGDEAAAGLAAAAWAVHPLRAQAVAWASGLPLLLATCFTLLAALAHLGSLRSSAGSGAAAWGLRTGLTATLVLLATLCKATAVPAPALLWAVGVAHHARAPGTTLAKSGLLSLRSTLWTVPGSLVGISVALFANASDVSGGSIATTLRLSRGQIERALGALGWYVAKTAWPGPTALRYAFVGSGTPAAMTVAAAAVAVTALLSQPQARRRRLALATVPAVLAFATLLLPTVGFVAHASTGLVTDRYAYLASAPLVLLAADLGALTKAAPGAAAGPARARRAAMARTAVALVSVSVVAAWGHASPWRSSEPLFSHAVAVTPDDLASWSVLSDMHHKQGRTADAEECSRRASAAPVNSDMRAVVDKCLALQTIGNLGKAEACYRGELATRTPNSLAETVTLYNLGRLLVQSRRPQEAVGYLERALVAKPNNGDVHFQLAVASKQLGDDEAAARGYQRALEIDPEFPDALHNLGNMRHAQGRKAEAVALWKRELLADPLGALPRFAPNRAHPIIGDLLDELGL